MKKKYRKDSMVLGVKNETRLEAFSRIENQKFPYVETVKVVYQDVENNCGGGFCNYVFNVVDNRPVFK